MSPPSAKLSVFVSGQVACIKIAGRANFTSSIDFKTLVAELMDRGFNCFVLDLSECLLMDSTFLGVLAGFGLKLSGAQNGNPLAPGIQLLNPNERVADLLENLGVAHLFKTVSAVADLPRELVMTETVATATPSSEEVKQNCLDAHKTLMAISPANVAKFKDVAQFLAEDLRKAKSVS
jgi:anti-sigma B factor antagonist